jgi:hypothetical protein
VDIMTGACSSWPIRVRKGDESRFSHNLCKSKNKFSLDRRDWYFDIDLMFNYWILLEVFKIKLKDLTLLQKYQMVEKSNIMHARIHP